MVLGIPAILLSVMTGGSEILVIIDKEIGGVISLCMAVLVGQQTLLKFSQRSEHHRVSGARYGGIQWSLE